MSSKNLIQIRAGAKAFGSRTLFSDATFAINEGEHVGVIGPNGAGKTTLFKAVMALAKEDELDEGEVTRAQGLRIGYLPQHDAATEKAVDPGTLGEFVERGSTVPVWEIRAIGRDLGLSEEDYDRKFTSLSGGYRMRAKLLHLLAQQPDLMLLDEPTNYLDLETLLVLENFLQGFRGAFLLISHDREFLLRVTDNTLEVEGGEVTKYPGNIDDYFEQKTMLREQLSKRILTQDAKRKVVLDFAAKFGAKATKAKQAQSRLKQLGKMETITLKPLPITASIRIPIPTRIGKLAIKTFDANFGYPEKKILSKVNIEILSGDHVGVVGLNGAGKSTLLKSLASALTPLSGSIEYGHGLEIGYYAQHVGEALDPNDTVEQALGRKAPRETKVQEILDIAGSLMFSGEAVKKKIGRLSGGEKARVALGQILLQRVHCLLLDEPTNHLDFYTVEALTQALTSFPGTLIVVSHDQSFIKRIVTKILEVNHGALTQYPGTYDDYVWSLQQGVLGQRNNLKPEDSGKKAKDNVEVAPTLPVSQAMFLQAKEDRRKKENRIKQIERNLPTAEKEAQKFKAQFESLNKAIAAGTADQEAIGSLGELHGKLEVAEETWLMLLEELETLKAALVELS